jgi:hypothetical protein
MAPTEMVARFKSLGNYADFFLGIISYIVRQENLKYYYIQLGRTIGYKSDVNLPALRPGIQLFQSGSIVRTSTLDIGSNPRGRPKTFDVVAAGEADGAPYWSDSVGEHTIHRFRAYYSPMSSL